MVDIPGIEPGRVFLRAVVGVWPTKARFVAGDAPTVRECFTFDIETTPPPAEEGQPAVTIGQMVAARLRRLVSGWLGWFGGLTLRQRRAIPRDNTDHELESRETDANPDSILTSAEVLALEGEEAEV